MTGHTQRMVGHFLLCRYTQLEPSRPIKVKTSALSRTVILGKGSKLRIGESKLIYPKLQNALN